MTTLEALAMFVGVPLVAWFLTGLSMRVLDLFRPTTLRVLDQLGATPYLRRIVDRLNRSLERLDRD